MISIERPLEFEELQNFKRIVVIFRFYDKKGIKKEVSWNEYRNENGIYVLAFRTEDGRYDVIPVKDMRNELTAINEWIKNSYICHEEGSIVIYTMGEEVENE